jgi:hypothetical protein
MDEPPPLVTSSMERLTNLIEKAEPILKAATEQSSLLPAEPAQPFSGLTDFRKPAGSK